MRKRSILIAAAALLVIPAAAGAVTVKNTGKADYTIGVDRGNAEETKTVAAGKAETFECKQGCGVTGPWGFSWMVVEDDTIESDGTNLSHPK